MREKAERINNGIGVRAWGTGTDEGLGLVGDVPRWSTLLKSDVGIMFVSTDDPISFANFYTSNIQPGDTCAGHSHNDFEQEFPVTTALEAKFCSIEADVVYCPEEGGREESLRLGHTDIYKLDQVRAECEARM